MKTIKIAIDGPSAAGKSSIAKIIAKKLGYVYIDTGAMYRCVAYYAYHHKIDIADEKSICDSLKDIQITMDNKDMIYLNGKDVTKEIRQDHISMGASKVSSYQRVREYLVEQQRALAKEGGVILDGRDIGTVVLPDAELKIYQVASVETRAKRRYLENQQRGIACSLDTIRQEIEQRDYQDTHREHSPLKKAEDAIELDTSTLSLEEVVDAVMAYIKEKIKEE